MIVTDILHNIFEILPELILGAGPFCVFKGMGTGKDSGKLIFKRIFDGPGIAIVQGSDTLNIIQSGSSTSAFQSIRDCEIAFGCGVGITSSSSERFKVEPLARNLYNLRMFGIDSSDTISFNDFNTSLITGGFVNYICSDSKPNQVFNSNIVAGRQNRLYRNGSNILCDSSIISGYQNRIYSYSQNTIISGENSVVEQSRRSSSISSNLSQISSSKNSTILTSSQGQTNQSYNSVILGSRRSTITSMTVASRNTFSSGNSNGIDSSFYSTTMNGLQNSIQCTSCIMTILNGYSNYLSRDQQTGVLNSSIINGRKNLMTNPNLPQSPCDGIVSSTILIGYYNHIKLQSGGRLDSVRDSIIANGKCNLITLDSTSFTQSTAILNGLKNCVYYAFRGGLGNGVIINGQCNYVGGGMINTILSGYCGYITGAVDRESTDYTDGLIKGNLISTSYKVTRSIINSNGSIIITKAKNLNNIFSGVGVNYISGPSGITGSSNLILGTNFERAEISAAADENLLSNTILSNHSNNCIIGSSSNSIIISYKNSCLINCNCTCTNVNGTITAPKSNFNSVIISNNSVISNGINSAIIGGSGHKIQTTKESVIIGGASNSINGFQAGKPPFGPPLYNTYWKSSGIIGGCNNILNSEQIGSREGCGVFLVALENKIARYTNSCVAVPSICVSGVSLFDQLTSTKTDGLNSGQFSLPLTSLCLISGIIINWSP